MTGASVRKLVRERAADRCEYCHTRQADEPFVTYQIEHIIPRQHGGPDDPDNLALACSQCSLHKGPNLADIDPLSGTIEPLFHPRRQSWDEHFGARGPYLFGRTPTGRATIRVLAMNDEPRVDLRREAGLAWKPPPSRSSRGSDRQSSFHARVA